MSSDKNVKNMEVHAVPTSQSLPQKETNERKQFWHVDKEMLRFKVHYFFFVGALSVCLPYMSIFAQERVGISPSGLAAILTSQQLLFIFTKPVIGYVSDYFNRLKATICSLSIVTTVSFFVLLAVPKIGSGKETVTLENFGDNSTQYTHFNSSEAYIICDFQQNDSSQSMKVFYNNSTINDYICTQTLDGNQMSNFLSQCSDTISNISENEGNDSDLSKVSHSSNSGICEMCCRLNGQCQSIDCEYQISTRNVVQGEKKSISDFVTYQFWFFAIISTVSMTCANSLFFLADTACCETVTNTGGQYGRQRMWGAISWGLMSPISGLFIDYTDDFLVSWILMAFMSFLSLLNMTKLKIIKPQFSKKLLKDVGTVLSSKEFLAFNLLVVFNGIGIGFLWFYLVLFLTDIGGSRFLCGMVMFVECFLGGIPFMFFSTWVIKKIGHFNILTLSLAAYGIRFFWYSQLHNPWFVLPAELLHGFTYGLFYPNVASFAKMSAKSGTEATTQAVLFTAHEGIGAGIGCVIAGLGFDSVGGHRTFLYTSMYAGSAAILSIVLHLLVQKQKRSTGLATSTNE